MDKTDRERQPFDLTSDYLANPLMSLVKLARYKFPAKMLSASDCVVDLACGTGMSSYFYAHSCKAVHGIDIDDRRAEWAVYEAACDNLTFHRGDILKLTPGDMPETLSAITMVDAIEHFSLEDGEAVLANCAALLRQSQVDGARMMIIGTPSVHSAPYRASHNKDHHLHEYDPAELRRVVERHFSRTLQFSMNDEVVHTGFDKLAWFFYVIAIL